jgi:membrane protein
VVVGSVALSALAFLIVLAPLILPTVLHYLPGLESSEGIVTVLRYGVASLLLVLALVVAHKWLASGKRRTLEIAPGIVVTLLLWMVSAFAFARYLAAFSGAYVRTYAGLASAMVALVFLYWAAGIFVYGGELNEAIRRERESI